MLRNHSHYSLLSSISRSEQIVQACKNAGYTHAGICDLATISGCVNFIQACKESKIKPIIGTEIVLTNGSTISLFCRNKKAWNQLLSVISISNNPENYHDTPRISIEELLKNISPDDFVCVDGYVGSMLFSAVMPDNNCVFQSIDSESIVDCLVPNYGSIARNHIELMRKTFKYYYLEINTTNDESYPITNVIKNIIYEIDPDHELSIPDTSSYYPENIDAIDHRVILCTKLKTTMKKLDQSITDSKNLDALKFIRSSKYYIKNLSFLKANYSDRQISNLLNIINIIEDINILSNPKLPRFDAPNNLSEDEYLKELCRHGWKKLISTTIPKEKHEIYKNRVLKELDVISKAKLPGYFLIVQDYVNYFRNKGCLVGPARGSGGGSLVCYLTGITLIDPIEYGLLFERFYNDGRNTEDHISLPDIDVDFPPDYRDEVIEYLKNKYGESRVCQMLTFGRLAGKSILKEVLRVNESCSFDQMNQITEKIPNEAAISDLLEEMDNPSVIRWVLENDREALIDYCWLDDDGNLQGEYAKIFQQAMRMEGIFKTQGKHAAGVVIASDSLEKICPMVKSSRNSEQIAGMEMQDLESLGCVKFDILGVNLLKKIAETVKEVNDELS
jgi:DNA polymerase-3 subunit alpha